MLTTSTISISAYSVKAVEITCIALECNCKSPSNRRRKPPNTMEQRPFPYLAQRDIRKKKRYVTFKLFLVLLLEILFNILMIIRDYPIFVIQVRKISSWMFLFYFGYQ